MLHKNFIVFALKDLLCVVDPCIRQQYSYRTADFSHFLGIYLPPGGLNISSCVSCASIDLLVVQAREDRQ